MQKTALQKLYDYGYERNENFADFTPGTTLHAKNYKAKALNHTIMTDIVLTECNFDEASVTGSIFRHCSFIDCSMDQADFEFCEFYNCTFQSNEPVISSFNESSFAECKFQGLRFHSCTFTGAFFYMCAFRGVEITVSTMENSLFRQCDFRNMDLRLLNMDYVEFDHPKMRNVVLPLDQIPFIFGALDYLRDTKDFVKISKGTNRGIKPETFSKSVIPLLREHFIKSRQFFPLANIYCSEGDFERGYEAIKDGLRAAISIRDFRMLKHFCKLIAYTGAFSSRSLHRLYNEYICRLYPQNDLSANIPNYARHIVEIKAILFSSAKKSSIRVSIGTNIRLSENQKMGKLLELIFSLGKHRGAFQENDIEVVLRQNSPLMVTIRLSGNELLLAETLAAYLSMTGISRDGMRGLPVLSQYYVLLPEQAGSVPGLDDLAQTCRRDLEEAGIRAVMLEYYVENFQQCCGSNEPVYYFNGGAASPQNLLTEQVR